MSDSSARQGFSCENAYQAALSNIGASGCVTESTATHPKLMRFFGALSTIEDQNDVTDVDPEITREGLTRSER